MKMKTNGFLLREAVRRWELRRDTAAAQFADSITKFEGDEKQTPDEIAAEFVVAETAVAKLQSAQARYNLFVQVEVFEETMFLCEAVKRLGGAGRLDKMWREASGKKESRYGGGYDDVRQAGQVRAKRVITVQETTNRANKAAAFSGALRAAIAKGNGSDVDSEMLGLDSKLLTE